MNPLLGALAAFVVTVSAAAVDRDKEKELDEAQDLIKDLGQASTLDRKWKILQTVVRIIILVTRLAYRCGMFFPDPKDPKALPVSPLLIFNSSWPAEECSTTGPDYDKYNTFCSNLVSSADIVNSQIFTLMCLVWKILQLPVSERPQHQEEEPWRGEHHRERHLRVSQCQHWDQAAQVQLLQIHQGQDKGSICWRQE